MKKLLIFLAVIVLLPATTFAKEKATIYMDIPDFVTIENNEKEVLAFKKSDVAFYRQEGNMKVFSNAIVEDDSEFEGFSKLVVNDSKSFTITPTYGEPIEDFYIELFSKLHEHLYVNCKYPQRVDIVDSNITVASEPGSSCKYSFGGYMPKSKNLYKVSGTITGEVSIKDSEKGAIVNGASGIITVVITNKDESVEYGGRTYFYTFGGETRISVKNNKPSLSNGIFVRGLLYGNKKTKSVKSLYLRPVNHGKNMFMTWNKVKGARSYVIYKYDPVKNEYVRVAIRNGQSANYYNIAHADVAAGYKYYIQPKSKSGGCGKNVCKKSYPVWAVAAGNAKGNVSKVLVNKKALRGKSGKTAKLTAKVSAGNGKPVLSKTIRWYSSNKKIAKVNKKTGKVSFRKKGKCRIWAKAHNGKNSKMIKVIVK